jgi:O-methyltransferase
MKWELALKRVAAKAGLSVQRLPASAWEGDAEFPRLLEEATKLTMVDPNRLFVLYQLARRAQAVKGDAAEVGVYRGGTARLFGRVFHGDRTLHLFDTFAGMPETDAAMDTHRKGDFADTSLEGVKAAMTGIPYVAFHPGFFPETAKDMKSAHFAFVHVDVDIHRSVKDACEFFYPRLAAGGVMVFDDYAARGCPGVKPAVDDFFRAAGEPTLALPTTQCVVIKSR